jgi:pimeloyl-ACP methyl ester carboxylesterase
MTRIAVEDFTIASTAPGIRLSLRHKWRPEAKAQRGEDVLLFVHGATYPAKTSFDLPIEGESMMDWFVQAGYEVYTLDVRGFGDSTRMAALDFPPEAHDALVPTHEAASDLASAVQHITQTHGFSAINVMGWSWGTSIAGLFTSQNNTQVHRLVLYAPMWLFPEALATPPNGVPDPRATTGAYRSVSREHAKARWLNGLTPAQAEGLIAPGVFDAWADATWATDPTSAQTGLLRAPNGPFADVMRYWKKGQPLYDAGAIRVPTLLIHAEWDVDLPFALAHGLFQALTHAPERRLIELSEGTHTVMLEKNRRMFFREILNFLTEPNAPRPSQASTPT